MVSRAAFFYRVLLIVGMPLGARIASAGWLLPAEGTIQFGAGLSRTVSRQEFNPNGGRSSLYGEFGGFTEGEYSGTVITLGGSYAVSDVFHLLGRMQYRQATLSYVDSVFVQWPNSGLGDITLSGRYGESLMPWLEGALQVGVRIPAGDTGTFGTVSLGTGTMDFEALAMVHVADTTGGVLPFGQAEYGMRFRGGSYGDEIEYRLEGGAELVAQHVGLHLVFDGVITQGAASSPRSERLYPGFGLIDNMTASRLMAGIYFPVSKKVAFAVDWQTVMGGRSVIAGNTFMLGITVTPQATASRKPKH